MIRYQFQWLKYQPDATTGEFVLMGYIALCLDTQELNYYITPHLQRAEHFFKAAPDYFKHTLRQGLQHIKSTLDNFQKHPAADELNVVSKIILPSNENALQWTPMQTGLAKSWDGAQVFLQRQVERYIVSSAAVQRPTDKSLTRELNQAFKHYHLLPYLQPYETVLDNGLSVHYDHAWKNGRMNIFKAVSFDLMQRGKIEKKVLETHGRLDLLGRSQNKEQYKIHLVSAYPTRLPQNQQQELKHLIDNTFKDESLHSQRVIVSLHNARQLDNFAKDMYEEIMAYHQKP